MEPTLDVLIVGAGLSGLIAGRRLQAAEPLDLMGKAWDGEPSSGGAFTSFLIPGTWTTNGCFGLARRCPPAGRATSKGPSRQANALQPAAWPGWGHNPGEEASSPSRKIDENRHPPGGPWNFLNTSGARTGPSWNTT
jgi:hypothetical protein